MNVYVDLLKKKKARKAKRVAKSKRLGLNGARTLKGRRKKADRLFAEWIRNRDGNRCVITGSTAYPQCSHYISRKFNGTRFNPANADCFSAKVHFDYEHKKEKEYREFKIKQLGQARHDALFVSRDANISLQEAVDGFFKWFDGLPK